MFFNFDENSGFEPWEDSAAAASDSQGAGFRANPQVTARLTSIRTLPSSTISMTTRRTTTDSRNLYPAHMNLS